MLARTLRSLTALVALIVAYQAYVLLAVPWIDPPLAVRDSRRATAIDRAGAEQTITKYQRLLGHYFPAEHWSQQRPPKVIESGSAMLVLDDYKRGEDGAVNITTFALLVFPTPYTEGLQPPRDAIIIEAPQGAQLQFDSFRPERGQIGQITRGEFPGRITIRSDMHAAGPADDLYVETSDLRMNTKLLYTSEPVRFRLGPNVGAGRELEIRFLTDDQPQATASGPAIGGIDALEIRRDVRLRLFLETDSLLPGDAKKPSGQRAPAAAVAATSGQDGSPSDPQAAIRRLPPASAAKPKEPGPPVEVACSGPFHFDFVRYVASFDRDVELRQINPNGPSDQLSAQRLDIHFAPRAEPGEPSPSPILDPSRKQQHELGRLEPAIVVARGHPVVVVSPAQSAEARGERIQLGLRERTVSLDGGRDVLLIYGPNQLRAPTIEYQHPERDAATDIGRFRAGGPGALYYIPDPAKPDEALQATWQTSVELGRHRGQPLLTLEGRPQLAFAGVGGLTADRLALYLRELQDSPAGDAGPASRTEPAGRSAGIPLSGMGELGKKVRVLPDRLSATGRVQIKSPQLTGRTQELVATFRAGSSLAPGVAAGRDESAAAEPRLSLPGREGGSSQAYHIEADLVRLEAFWEEGRAKPDQLACDGNVVFREVPQRPTAEQPLEVRGGQLTVEGIETGAQITITGTAPGERPGSKVAQLLGRGVTMLADVVRVDQAANRLWIDGPGKATMMVAQDFAGGPTAAPYPLEIVWQGGLDFDGRRVTLDRDVRIESEGSLLRCDRLIAKLTAEVKFGEAINEESIDLAEIDCQGRVALRHRSRDGVGPTADHRMDLARLTVDQQTGAVRGEGPGAIRSSHFADQIQNRFGPLGAAAGSPPAGSAERPRLYFLRIDFQLGLVGNLYTRELTFQRRVRTVYGPVDSWEQEIDPLRPETVPPESVTLTCDELSGNEDPIAARAAANPYSTDRFQIGPVQMRATGNVRIDGQAPKQGFFTAQAHRASYEQAKDVFLLEGDARTPATLWLRRNAGDPAPPQGANKIRYVPSTGDYSLEDIRFLEYVPPSEPPQNATGPAPRRQ